MTATDDNPDGPKRTKTNAAQVAARVEETLRVMLHGGTFADLRDHAAAPEQAWNVSDSQLKKYVGKALKLCRARNGEDRAALLAMHEEARKVIISKSMEAGDWRAALLAWKDLAELSGLYATSLELRLQALERKLEERHGDRQPDASRAHRSA